MFEEAGDGVPFGTDIPLEVTFISPKLEESGDLTPIPDSRLSAGLARVSALYLGAFV